MLAKEVLFIVGILSGRHGKGLAGTLSIIAGDDRRMHIDKALILEKLMDRH